jgi:uncharacterized membrane protein YfcA
MDLSLYSVIVLAIAFVWSGLVRAGLGFGGAGLMYPIALLAVDSVVFLVPILCVQLMIFSTATLARDHAKIDWRNVRLLLAVMTPPFVLGVFGLINFSETVLLIIVYVVMVSYALSYIFNFHTSMKQNWWVDGPIAALGSYLSGLSLAGSPLLAAVAIRLVEREKLRATLFVVWWILCAIKLSTLAVYQVDLQLRHQLWLLPCALIGHMIGMRVHDWLMQVQSPRFYRFMGIALLALCLVGIVNQVVF